MNSVALVGRLTRDPDLRYTPSQLAVARFSIAVNRPFSKNNEADFINIVVFGKSAENCGTYLKKGSQVGVTGRIQTGSYEKDGRRVYTTDVVADRVEFLSRASESAGGNSNQYDQRSRNNYQNNDFGFGGAPDAGLDSGIPDGFHAFDDDDDENLPF